MVGHKDSKNYKAFVKTLIKVCCKFRVWGTLVRSGGQVLLQISPSGCCWFSSEHQVH